MTSDEKEKIRDIPTSLRGIRAILQALYQDSHSLFSIRQISASANISIRVAKNILLELEKLKQVERVTDSNQILPKWRLTKLGKDVANALRPDSTSHDSKQSHLDYLMSRITIPSQNEVLNAEIARYHSGILTELNNLQINLSKSLGLCYNLDHSVCAEYIGKLITKLKQMKIEMNSLITNPLGIEFVHKLGSFERKMTNETKKQLAEKLFTFQLILNQLNYCADLEYKIRSILETGECNSFHTHFSPLSHHIRILAFLVDKSKLLDTGVHILNNESLDQICANLISISIIEQFLPPTLPLSQIQSQLKEEVIHLITTLINHEEANLQGEEKFNFYPLISFYQLVKDHAPYTDFSIGNIESILDELSEQGYIPGLKVINPGTSEAFKIVQLISHDLSKDELTLIQYAVKARQFTLSDAIIELHWERIKTEHLLNVLTNNGILRHSNSYLHGEKWYVISE